MFFGTVGLINSLSLFVLPVTYTRRFVTFYISTLEILIVLKYAKCCYMQSAHCEKIACGGVGSALSKA